MKKTKEERYLLKLHAIAKAKGNQFTEVNAYSVGEALKFGKPSTTAIIKILAMSHLIKKINDQTIALTVNGETLVNELLD